jgi:hypothetical protein
MTLRQTDLQAHSMTVVGCARTPETFLIRMAMAKQTQKKVKRTARSRGRSVAKERMAVAEEMSKSPTMTVTLRIPAAFNAWLDAYRHLSYPQRVGKQELVVEGLKMVYLQRGRPGEPILTPWFAYPRTR